jgi:hypothetical protein
MPRTEIQKGWSSHLYDAFVLTHLVNPWQGFPSSHSLMSSMKSTEINKSKPTVDKSIISHLIKIFLIYCAKVINILHHKQLFLHHT